MSAPRRAVSPGFLKIVFAILVATAPSIFSNGVVLSLPERKPLLMAHRGGDKETDENTIKSYTNAINHGMDFIECDPRLTKDGVFVIMHDATVNRTTDGQGRVDEKTFAEIKALKTKHGESVPAFEEALDLAKKRGVSVFVDTKLYTEPYMEQLVALIEKMGMESRVTLGLWTVEQLKWMKKNHPLMTTCIPYPAPMSSLKQAKKSGAAWAGTLLEQATPAMIAKAGEAGLKVVTMPINDRETIILKINEGTHVIQTDDPKLLREIIDELWPPGASGL